MADEAAGGAARPRVSVQVVTGEPIVTRATDMYRQMLSAAGVEGADEATAPGRPPWHRSFHVAVDDTGRVLGVILARLGPLDRLTIRHMIDPEVRLAGPICEAPTSAVLPEGQGLGVTELLYRSVYCFARRHGAGSLATILDPVTLALFRDDYAVSFRPLGPMVDDEGVQLQACGEEIHTLEADVRRLRPEFYEFLIEPFTAAERAQMGL